MPKTKSRISVGITGGRDYPKLVYVAKYFTWFLKHCEDSEIPLRLVHGGARGVDQLVDAAARIKFHFPSANLIVLKPNYERYGKAAPFVRNDEIVRQSDVIVAFWDGNSPGTLDTIRKAVIAGKPVVMNPKPGILPFPH
jgi:hypothetical protein